MDLSCRYMGLELKNPLIAAASPMTADLDKIKRLEDAGIAAIVLPSLFEEQIDAEIRAFDRIFAMTSATGSEAAAYFPNLDFYKTPADTYLQLISNAKATVDVPVIASLNGTTGEGWTSYAREMEQAGADGLELNIYFIPGNIDMDGREVEQRYEEIVKAVRKKVKIPLSVKLGPHFSSAGNMAMAMDRAGADGLALFNRFYQPDIDLETLELLTNLKLSDSDEIRVPLLWLAVLYKKIKASLAATSGVTGHQEALKYLLSGADAVMTASALLRHGPGYVSIMLAGMQEWMEKRGYESIHQMRGVLSQEKVVNPQAFERANYIKILQGYPQMEFD